MDKTKYKTWTLIDWDGNRSLNLKCWRKSFGRGYVSVGVGDFQDVYYSHGPNSDDSMGGTRWNYNNPVWTEQEMMDWVDKCKGYHQPIPSRPGEIKW